MHMCALIRLIMHFAAGSFCRHQAHEQAHQIFTQRRKFGQLITPKECPATRHSPLRVAAFDC